MAVQNINYHQLVLFTGMYSYPLLTSVTNSHHLSFTQSSLSPVFHQVFQTTSHLPHYRANSTTPNPHTVQQHYQPKCASSTAGKPSPITSIFLLLIANTIPRRYRCRCIALRPSKRPEYHGTTYHCTAWYNGVDPEEHPQTILFSYLEVNCEKHGSWVSPEDESYENDRYLYTAKFEGQTSAEDRYFEGSNSPEDSRDLSKK